MQSILAHLVFWSGQHLGVQPGPRKRAHVSHMASAGMAVHAACMDAHQRAHFCSQWGFWHRGTAAQQLLEMQRPAPNGHHARACVYPATPAMQPILVVESDKADMDVESFNKGVLAAITCPEGERAAVGAPIGFTAETEEEVGNCQRVVLLSEDMPPAAQCSCAWLMHILLLIMLVLSLGQVGVVAKGSGLVLMPCWGTDAMLGY